MIDLNDAKAALNLAIERLKLQPDVEIVDIQHGHVLTLDFTQDPAFPDFAHHMIQIERAMKIFLGTRDLELICIALADKNKRDIKSGRVVATMISGRNIEKLD